MEFRLVYRGALRSNDSVAAKHKLRRALHPQLKALWNQPPLEQQRPLYMDANAAFGSLRQTQGRFTFAPLVNSKLSLVAELDILFLRRQRPGALLHHGGDIDNRLKTLLDSLRVPQAKQSEIPQDESPLPGEDPLYCLLEDDALVTRLTVTTDQLLEPGEDPSEAWVVIHVTVKDTAASRWWSLG